MSFRPTLWWSNSGHVNDGLSALIFLKIFKKNEKAYAHIPKLCCKGPHILGHPSLYDWTVFF